MIKVKVKATDKVGVKLAKTHVIHVGVRSTLVEYTPRNMGRIAYDGTTLRVY